MISGITKCTANVLWCTNDENEFIVEKADGSMEAVAFFKSSREDAELFSDALAVANETGLTPQQLLEQRNELLAASSDLLRLIEHPSADHDETLPQIVNMNAAISKAESGNA